MLFRVLALSIDILQKNCVNASLVSTEINDLIPTYYSFQNQGIAKKTVKRLKLAEIFMRLVVYLH